MPDSRKLAVSSDSVFSIRDLVPKDHKLYHFFNFVDQNYDRPEDVLKAMSTMLDFDKGLRALLQKKGKRNILGVLKAESCQNMQSDKLKLKSF